MNILDDLYRIADFNINMCTIFASQIKIVQYHSCYSNEHFYHLHVSFKYNHSDVFCIKNNH